MSAPTHTDTDTATDTDYDSASESGLLLPDDVDAVKLREVLGRHHDVFVAGGLAALNRGGHLDRWVQIGLAPREGRLRELHAKLRTLAEDLLAGGQASNFFYMRKPPGLRVRFETDPAQRDRLLGLLRTETTRWEPELASVHPGRYEPEELLFGGPDSMTHVHRLFTADSVAWLTFFAIEERPPSWTFSLAMLHSLLRGLKISNWEDLEVWERVRRQAFRAVPDALDKDKVAAVTGRMRALWDDQDALRTALGDQAAHLADEHGARLRRHAERWESQYFAAGETTIGPREAAAFAAIFHWNRGAVSAVTQAMIAAALADRSARP